MSDKLTLDETQELLRLNAIRLEKASIIIHRTSSVKEKDQGKPKGLWCGQETLPMNEAQTHKNDNVTCQECLRKIKEYKDEKSPSNISKN